MKKYSAIGIRQPRIDGAEKASGAAKYSGDIILPEMLYGKILRSPHPHARLVNIDTTKAARLPGVKLIITGKDTPGVKFGSSWRTADQYPLALDKVRYIGEEVAAIAAIDEDIAEEALDLIEVEYDILPYVFDPEEALRPESPGVHDEKENNIANKVNLIFGDVEKGFQESDYVQEDKFVTEPFAHCAMEPHTTVATYDLSGKITVWTSNMSPFAKRRILAGCLKMPDTKIRVARAYVGGAFGGKAEMFPLDFCAAFLSLKTGQPVRISYTREEVFRDTRQRHPTIIHLKTGVKKDGTFLAKECKAIIDAGAYSSIGPITILITGANMGITYKVPNIKYEGYCVHTNKPIRGAMRGHGMLPYNFAEESQMDMIAEELGLDPVEIRLKNARVSGEILPTGMELTSCGLIECIQKASEVLRWKDRKGNLTRKRGVGIGCSNTPTAVLGSYDAGSSVYIKFNEDGGISLITGAIDTGAGLDTMLAQIAAEDLGLSVDEVTVTSADTDFTPPDVGSWLMAVAYVTGNAVLNAAADAKRQLFEIAAKKLEANVEDLEMKDKRIYVKGSPEKGLSLSRVVLESLFQGTPIAGKGSSRGPGVRIDAKRGLGMMTPVYTFCAQAGEVEVDEETGLVQFLHSATAYDCGFALNPMDVEGQMEGCISMTQGQGMYEAVVLEKGDILNPSFLDYKIPLSTDVPQMDSIIINTIDPGGPFGAKEGGHAPACGGTATIANAIYDAIGVRIKSIPITPEKILQGLEEKVTF